VRHIHEEYQVNVIVEPGVVDEVKDKLPFAYTPPSNGVVPLPDSSLTRYTFRTTSNG
jgi:hypothetical protein